VRGTGLYSLARANAELLHSFTRRARLRLAILPAGVFKMLKIATVSEDQFLHDCIAQIVKQHPASVHDMTVQALQWLPITTQWTYARVEQLVMAQVAAR
jgi:hypothetical protein